MSRGQPIDLLASDAYSQIPLHSSAPLNPTPYGYDGPPLASRILYGDSTAVTKLMDGIFLGGIEAGQDLECQSTPAHLGQTSN